MRRVGQAFVTACWFALAGHVRNRLALVLAVFFIPAWIWLVRAVTYTTPVPFHVSALGGQLTANSNHMNQITAALNADTLIVGFMMFFTTFKAGEVDRRLVLAGFPRGLLLLAKAVGLVAVAAAMGLYCALFLCLFWPVQQPGLLAGALIVSGLVYGGIGIMLGSLLRGELEGLFLVIMISLVDVALQNPSVTPYSGQPGLWALPLHGPLQLSIAAGFTHAIPLRYLLHGLIWFAVACVISLAIFYVRTWSYPKAVPVSAAKPADVAEDGRRGYLKGTPRTHEDRLP